MPKILWKIENNYRCVKVNGNIVDIGFGLAGNAQFRNVDNHNK